MTSFSCAVWFLTCVAIDNTVGDAANEPSIAPNELNPANLVIGWRQFDTIASNFRQAGYGYTTDGGQTWNELTNGLPEGSKGKIGLAISPQRPDVLYAAIELDRRTVKRRVDRALLAERDDGEDAAFEGMLEILERLQELTGEDRYRPTQWLSRRALLDLPIHTPS